MSQPPRSNPDIERDRRPRRGWSHKFGDAFAGIRVGMRGQSSFLVHGPCSLAVVLLAFLLQLPLERWCLLLMCIGIVLAAELANSSLETICRRITDQEDPYIRDALNIASGAVLMVSIMAAVVGGLIFLQPLLQQMAG